MSLGPASHNVLISTSPKHLRITETMICDFLFNPVLGAEILLNQKLDEFQKVALKICWWVPRVMDSSGFSSSKTKRMTVLSVLRCLLLSDRHAGVYYQVFNTGQKTYWSELRRLEGQSKYLRAAVGRIDSETETEHKGKKMGPSCWTCEFKNGSQIMMPAPGFLQDAKTQASLRLNDLYIDEWTKIVATGSTGIDDQLIGRATRAVFNQHHPIWANHHLFLATAEDTMHPGYDKYKNFKKEVDRGNPDYAIFSFSFKDYSNLPCSDGLSFREKFRDVKALRDMKTNKSAAGYLQEGLGIWSQNGKGWYSQDLMDQAYAAGVDRQSKVMISADEDTDKENVFYFLGADPAKADNKKSDDGALIVIRAKPLVTNPRGARDWDVRPCWAYKVRRADGPTWSGLIHRKHQQFRFSAIGMDYNGGGQWIRPELAKKEQKIRDVAVKVDPIFCVEDEAVMITGQPILIMFSRSDRKIQNLWGDMVMRGEDNLVDKAHTELLEAFQTGSISLPPRIQDTDKQVVGGWSEEKQWAAKMLELMVKQLQAVSIQTNPDGSTYYSKNGARAFSAKGRKDFAYALKYAYTAFLSWLQSRDLEDFAVPDEDSDMCG